MSHHAFLRHGPFDSSASFHPGPPTNPVLNFLFDLHIFIPCPNRSPGIRLALCFPQPLDYLLPSLVPLNFFFGYAKRGGLYLVVQDSRHLIFTAIENSVETTYSVRVIYRCYWYSLGRLSLLVLCHSLRRYQIDMKRTDGSGQPTRHLVPTRCVVDASAQGGFMISGLQYRSCHMSNSNLRFLPCFSLLHFLYL